MDKEKKDIEDEAKRQLEVEREKARMMLPTRLVGMGITGVVIGVILVLLPDMMRIEMLRVPFTVVGYGGIILGALSLIVGVGLKASR